MYQDRMGRGEVIFMFILICCLILLDIGLRIKFDQDQEERYDQYKKSNNATMELIIKKTDYVYKPHHK